jgi:hypothetical protein
MIQIERALNGYIVHTEEGTTVYQDDIHGVQELMYDLLHEMGHTGSRYDMERIYVRIEPGDKYEAN